MTTYAPKESFLPATSSYWYKPSSPSSASEICDAGPTYSHDFILLDLPGCEITVCFAARRGAILSELIVEAISHVSVNGWT